MVNCHFWFNFRTGIWGWWVTGSGPYYFRIAKELSKAGDHYSKVYINKDIHPAVRQEIGRLKKRAKEESDKSENSESNIIYDPKNRVVKKDGIIIDRFTPKFF